MCSVCGNKGHMRKACRSAALNSRRGGRWPRRVGRIQDTDDRSSEEEEIIGKVSQCKGRRRWLLRSMLMACGANESRYGRIRVSNAHYSV